MLRGTKATATLLLIALGGLVVSVQLVAAPPAHACPPGQMEDWISGMCWTQSGQGTSFCDPGELNCTGSLQTSVPSLSSADTTWLGSDSNSHDSGPENLDGGGGRGFGGSHGR